MTVTISDQISIVVHRTDLTFIRYATDQLRPFDIAPEQNLAILLLAERSPRTQSELGHALTKDKTNMTRLLGALERKGLVERENSEGDRRSLTVSLTASGRQLAARTRPIAARFQELLTTGISASDLDVFTRTLEAMNTNLHTSVSHSQES